MYFNAHSKLHIKQNNSSLLYVLALDRKAWICASLEWLCVDPHTRPNWKPIYVLMPLKNYKKKLCLYIEYFISIYKSTLIHFYSLPFWGFISPFPLNQKCVGCVIVYQETFLLLEHSLFLSLLLLFLGTVMEKC